MKNFKKVYELGMEITNYERDVDYHVFTIGLSKSIIDIEGKNEIDKFRLRVFNILDPSYYVENVIKDDSTLINLNEYDIIYHIFDRNVERELQKMCLEYCQINKLPISYMDGDIDNGYEPFIYDEIKDILINDNINDETILTIKFKGGIVYDCDPNFKKTSFKLTQNSIEFQSEYLNLIRSYEWTDGVKLNNFILESCNSFVRDWNSSIVGKFQWEIPDMEIIEYKRWGSKRDKLKIRLSKPFETYNDIKEFYLYIMTHEGILRIYNSESYEFVMSDIHTYINNNKEIRDKVSEVIKDYIITKNVCLY